MKTNCNLHTLTVSAKAHRRRDRMPCGNLSGWVLALALIGVTGGMPAAPITEAKVSKAVETWVRHLSGAPRPDAAVARLEPYRENGVTMAYVVHLAGGGYCLAGADSLVLPVYWHSPIGTYDPRNPELQVILEDIAGRLGYLRNEMAKGGAALRLHQNALARRASHWDDLSAGRVPSTPTAKAAPAGPMRLELPLTSQWHQGFPYNDMCPGVPALRLHPNTVVGCVATAMAQVMYYWRWPDTGTGTLESGIYEYRWTNGTIATVLANDPGIPPAWGTGLYWAAGQLFMGGCWDETVRQSALKIPADSAYRDALNRLWNELIQVRYAYGPSFDATYDWSQIHDRHPAPAGLGDVEVAKLCYHAGLAVGMNYGLDASSASLSALPGALANHFRYDPDATFGGRNVDRMVEEIQWLRPLILRGNESGDEGHAWVVLGYRVDTDPWQFLMNLGWNGAAGWLAVDDVYPLQQNHVTRVAPLDVVRFIGAADAGRGSPSDPYRDIEEAVAKAPDGATLIFRTDSVNTFAASILTIARPLTLKGVNVTLQRR